MAYVTRAKVVDGDVEPASDFNQGIDNEEALKGMAYTGCVFSLKNNTANTLPTGTVVVFDPAADSSFKTSTLPNDPSVIGIILDTTIAAAAIGNVASQGGSILDVLVQGNVTRGHWLSQSTIAGRAMDSGFTQKPTSGAIGIALTGYADGSAGTVKCLLNLNIASSNALLQKLATVSIGNSSGAVTSLTFAHMVDSGTDLLVVSVSLSVNTSITSVTWNGIGMTAAYNYGGTGGANAVFYLRNPTPGTYNVVITTPSTVLTAIAVNFIGSMSSNTFRTGLGSSVGAGITISVTPVSALGDIVIDMIEVNAAGWSPTAGQTLFCAEQSHNSFYFNFSYHIGAAGTTTMSWAGTNATGRMAGIAIAGS